MTFARRAGSSAASAGHGRIGDRVIRIDGVPVAERGCRPLEPSDGEVRLFTVQRGTEELDLAIDVEVLVR